MKLILISTGIVAGFLLSSCGGEPDVYNWRIHQKPETRYYTPSSSPSYKVGGAGYQKVGGSDTASGFRASGN
ncbi:MAG: hypothetical protein AB8F34_02750 [Akkermansiaceae bacterium]